MHVQWSLVEPSWLEESKQESSEKKQQGIIQETLKQVAYGVVEIPKRSLQHLDYFYAENILVDLRMRDEYVEDRYSSWNKCLTWPLVNISRSFRSIVLDPTTRQQLTQDQIILQVQQYKRIPDQKVHSFMSQFEVLLALKMQLSLAFSSFILEYRFQLGLKELSQTYLQEFDLAMAEAYKQMAAEQHIFLSSHCSLDVDTKQILLTKFIISEPLANLLGRSLEELQDMFLHTGSYDFYDLEGSLEINEIIIQERIATIQQLLSGILPVKQPAVKLPQKLKLITYDHLTFYAETTYEVFRLSHFKTAEELTNFCPYLDFCAGIYRFDISINSLEQIIALCSAQAPLLPQLQSLDYALQSEVFIDKYIKNNSSNHSLKSENNSERLEMTSERNEIKGKICGYKYIMK